MRIILLTFLMFFELFNTIANAKSRQNKSFAIYVAFVDAKAQMGNLDKQFSKTAKQIDLSKEEFLVGHAGVIIGDGKTGNTEFYDFGRFNAPKEGYGSVRKGGDIKGVFKPTNATFNEKGEVNNSEAIVQSLFGQESYFTKHNFGSVEYAVYGDLDYDKMKIFANEHDAVVYGFSPNANFCAQFVHQVINAGGGDLVHYFALTLLPIKSGIEAIFKRNGRNVQKASEEIKKKYPELPLPEFEVKRIQAKFPELNQGNKILETN